MKSKLLYIDESVESTEDCVKLLNEKFKTGKWKRKTKFKFPNKNEVRIFTDGNDIVSIVNTDEGAIICPEIDLSTLRPLIDRIEKVCKKLYTYDYGDVWFNPYEMRLWINGGDGGIEYGETESKFINYRNKWNNDTLTEEDEAEYVDAEEKMEELFPELKIQFEGEHNPYRGYGDEEEVEEEEDLNFINIANIIDCGNLEGLD